VLPDGREVLIAGEHEDYYDPDFFIYNDVVVRAPDGKFAIYGYSKEAFPPTDFHTATLLPGQHCADWLAGLSGRATEQEGNASPSVDARQLRDPQRNLSMILRHPPKLFSV